MTINPTTKPINWIATLPRYVRQWIKDERHQDFSEIVEVRLTYKNPYEGYAKYVEYGSIRWGLIQHRYEVTFTNGYTAMREFQPYGEDCGVGNVRITGYNETILPNYWVHQYIMEQPIPGDMRVPDYQQTSTAYSIVPHVLQRGQSDLLAMLFARKLVNDASIEDEVLFTMVKMGVLATTYTASQVCTAAYQAWNEIERGQE